MKPSRPFHSIALAGLLAFGASAQADVIANSLTDFSGTQGANGWYYGYYSGALDTASFQELTTFSGGAAWGLGTANGDYWTRLWAYGGHSQGTITSGGKTPADQWAVRRWVAPAAGSYLIDLSLAKLSYGVGGNGVVGHVYVNGVDLFSQWIAGNDTTGINAELTVDVLAGATIDFALDPYLSNDLADSTHFTAVISTVPEPSPEQLLLAGLGALVVMTRLRSKRVERLASAR